MNKQLHSFTFNLIINIIRRQQGTETQLFIWSQAYWEIIITLMIILREVEFLGEDLFEVSKASGYEVFVRYIVTGKHDTPK